MSEADLPHSCPSVTDKEIEAVRQRLIAGLISAGDEAAQVTTEVAGQFGCRGGRVIASGTAAIAVALVAAGVVPGDDVLMPTYCCGDVSAAIRATGARPVLADLHPGRWTSEAPEYAAVCTDRTTAVVAVRTFGHPVAIGGAKGVAALGLPVIEDACQVPSPPDPASAYTVFSFHATKSLAAGEGGFIGATDMKRLEALHQGRADDWATAAPMSDLAATLLRVQIARWEELATRRQDLAARYLEKLPLAWTAQLRSIIRAETPFVPFRLPLLVDSGSESLMRRAHNAGVNLRRGVDSLRHYDPPDAVHAPLRKYPEAERRLATTVSPPLHPSMSDHDFERVIAATCGGRTSVPLGN